MIKTIDEYIQACPEESRAHLRALKQTIQKSLPAAEEVISYGIGAFNLNNHYLVYIAGYKNHVSVYPRPHGDEALQKELAPYESGKGTLRFNLDKPVPVGLIKKVVLALKTESEAKTR